MNFQEQMISGRVGEERTCENMIMLNMAPNTDYYHSAVWLPASSLLGVMYL